MGNRILIIEDDKSVAELERDYLEVSDFSVDIANDGFEGLRMVSENDYSLVILDIMLPGMDGFEVLKSMRAESNIPILMVTARKDDVDKILGLGLGADDYITKPFSPKEMVLRVNNIIKRVYKEDGRVNVDGYDIDESKRMVFENGIEMDLTTKEFDLLMLFVKNKGIAFSREQILVKIWDDNYFGSDRVVDDTMRRLRKKLPNINIQTIYGFGYRLG